MGDPKRVRSTSARTDRLADLGAEVSSSLEEARSLAGSGVRERVRMKLVTKQMPQLRAATSAKKRSVALPMSYSMRGVAGAFAIAATIAITAFFSYRHREGEVDAAHRATRDPALSFVIGEASSPARQEGTVGAFIAASSSSEMPVTFSDGSKIRLEPSARVRVAEVANNGARVHLESGSVHVHVVHKDEATRWAVEAGPYEVKVTGTKFDVAWDPASTGIVVKLTEGSVLVHGCGLAKEGRRLVAGEELRSSCDDSAKKADDERVAEAPAPSPTTPPAPPPSPVAPPPVATPQHAVVKDAALKDPHAIVALARRGAHTEALAAAEANGFTTTCESLQGPELLLLADAARYAGRFDRATEALEITRRRFAGSDAAATAAFELGRIEMDIRRELGAAGDHFETYLRERPSGTLAREALGRAIEARHRGGDSGRAERLAVRYLAAYPDGPHAKLARKLTAAESAHE